VSEAIARHHNEAELARLGFERLSAEQRASVIAFLATL
jgi:hypothetical protein